METQRTHPLIITAAVAIILTCAVGLASMTGLWPSSKADSDVPEAALTEQSQADTANKGDSSPSKPVHHNKSASKPATLASASPNKQVEPPVAAKAATCQNCGRVSDVRPIRIQGEGSGLGAVAGGVAGAVLGKQFGNGGGQKAMTVAGAIGGAMLGNKIEKDQRSATVYDVEVTFEDGTSGTYRQNSNSWQIGDRVKVVNGQLTAD